MSSSMYELRVYYEDTDCGQVVYYSNYLRFFERSRTEFMRERGVDIKDMMARDVHFVVTRIEVDFKAPAMYGDVLQIETSITEGTKVRFEFSYIIREKISQRVLVTGKTVIACITDNSKPQRIPQDVYAKLFKE
ncbi:MAG: YbgC/FadM family acyl-CoA thioesterase [Elusimicrobiota bacterium]